MTKADRYIAMLNKADKVYQKDYSTGEYCHEQSFKWGFQEGYEQSEKDVLEKAIVWMKENAKKYIVDNTPTYPDAEPDIYIGGKCWEHLKQAMEEE